MNKKRNVRKSPSKPSSRKEKFNWQVAVLFIIPFILYANTLQHQYALDDAIVITENNFTKQGFSGIGDILQNETFVGFFGIQKDLVAGARYRPLSLVTFAIEYEFFGLNPVVSHFINILLYTLTGLVLYFFLKLFIANVPGGKRYIHLIPFLATLIFIVHPIHTEAVANIKGRDEILCMLLSSMALFAFVKFMLIRKPSFFIIGCLSFFLALLTKENAYTFVFIIPLAAYFVLDNKRGIGTVFLSVLLIAILGFIIRSQVIGSLSTGGSNDLMNNPFAGASFSGHYATVMFTLGKYLQLMVFPHPLTHDYYPYHISLVNWGNFLVLTSIAAYLLMFYFGIKGLIKRSIPGFALIFYLITFSIVSNIVFPVGTFMGERLLFMPSFGIVLLFSWILVKIPVWLKRKEVLPSRSIQSFSSYFMASNPLGLIVLIIIILGFSYKTIDRNPVWENDTSLFLTDVHISVNSAKVNNAAGGKLYDLSQIETDPVVQKQQLEQAFIYLQKALEIYPNYQASWTTLGNVYYFLHKDYQKAIEAYSKANDTKSYQNLLNIGQRAFMNKEYSNAILCFSAYKRFLPGNIDGYLELGQAYLENRQPDQSIAILNEALNKFPQSDILNLRLGLAYGRGKGNVQQAIPYFNRAIEINPRNVEALENLGVAYGLINQPHQSVIYFERALALSPGNAGIHQNLGNAYKQLGNMAKANEHFNQATTINNK